MFAKEEHGKGTSVLILSKHCLLWSLHSLSSTSRSLFPIQLPLLFKLIDEHSPYMSGCGVILCLGQHPSGHPAKDSSCLSNAPQLGVERQELPLTPC